MNSFLKINRWLVFMLILGNLVNGQNQNASDLTTLKNKLQSTTTDSSKIRILNEIITVCKYTNAQEGLKYGNKALALAEKKLWDKETAIIHSNIGTCYASLFNYDKANIHFQKALLINQKKSYQQGIASTYKDIALSYSSQKKYTEALYYFEKSLETHQFIGDQPEVVYSLNDMANLYFIQNNNQKALEYYNKSIVINQDIKDPNGYAYSLSRIGEIHIKEKNYTKAISYFRKAIDKYDKNQLGNIDYTLKQLSNAYLLLSKSDTKNKTKYVELSKNTLKQVSSKQQQYSQSVASLKADLKITTIDTVRINILNRIASSYFYTNPKEGIAYGEKALNLATKTNWKNGIALANDNLGVCHWVLTDYTKALHYFYQSLTVYEELKDQNGISGTLNNLGLVNIEIKNYKKAFKYLDKAYEINKKTDNKIEMVYNRNNIANAYYEQKNYTKALDYYNKSKEINLSMNDLNGLGYCYSKIGQLYTDQKKYTKSLYYFKEALKSYDKGQTYNIGNTYIEMGISYYKMAIESPNNKKVLLAKSELYLINAVNLFTETGILDRLSICYLELYKTSKEQGNFAKSLNYFEKHNTLKDSLSSSKNKNKLTNLQSKREIELRDKQIEIQNLKINSNSKKVYLLVIITATIALLLILFFWLYINKRSTNQLLLDKNKVILNINKQKDKFFSIIAHDLRGPFTGFLGLTELLAEDINDMDKEDIQFAAVNMRSSANNLNRLLENLLEWSRMEQGLIPFNPQENILFPVVKECIATLEIAAQKKEIKIQNNIPEKTNIYADNNILHAVIRNILSNAVKFTPKGGKIVVESKENEKGTVISIEDSGIGMNAQILENLFQLDVKTNRMGTDDEPSSGLGLILCKEFIVKHGGQIWVESKENLGSTFYFNFPQAI